MEKSPSSEPRGVVPPKEVEVKFTNNTALVPEPKAPVGTTDAGGRAPRNRESRRIRLVDDGKLFEGHFTVQSRQLKSIIQYLLDRHNEQDVIIQDLQKQVLLLRTRHLKARVREGGERGRGLLTAALSTGTAAPEDNVGERLKRIEQFMQLWGFRSKEVAELVEEYGDPIVTPEAYTSFLMGLPAFRLSRSEARASIATAALTMSAVTAAASDTAARRRNTNMAQKRDTSPSGSSPVHGRTKSEENPAETVLEKANAALEKAETLLAELRGTTMRAPPLSRKDRRAEGAASEREKSSGGGNAVDAEARADIEELGDYVMRRFTELEAQTTTAVAAAAKIAASRGERGGSDGNNAIAAASKPSSARSKGATSKKNAVGSSPSATPLASAALTSGGEAVDSIAREDAAASLDLLEELEVTMERRFKEVNNALASIAVRTAALAKNGNAGGNGGANSAAQSTEAERNSTTRAGSAASLKRSPGRARSGSAGKKLDRTAEDAGMAQADESIGSPTAPLPSSSFTKPTSSTSKKSKRGSVEELAPLIPTALVPAAAVDQVAREETAILSDRVGDLEEELLERWQSMEERLRIIGRAAMKQNVSDGATGPGGTAIAAVNRAPVVDRKAREDAALSLMRLQQLEKELSQLKRWWSTTSTSPKPLADSADLILAQETLRPTDVGGVEEGAPLRDTYGGKVADLEKEVEQRMAEVNEAIAQLRGGPAMASTGSRGNASGLVNAGTADRMDVLSDIHAFGWSSSPLQSLEPHATAPNPPPLTPLPTSSVSPTLMAAPSQSSLTLRATDGDAPRCAATAEGVRPDVDMPRWNMAASDSALDDHYGNPMETGLLATYPLDGAVLVGAQHRITSRLRSPNAPTFGSHLVQRAVVEVPADRVIAAEERPRASDCARRISDATIGALSSITQRDFLTKDRQVPLEYHALSPTGAAKVASALAQLPEGKEKSSTATTPHQHRRDTLGHSEPCVVVNCAWCDAEKAAELPADPEPLLIS